VVFAPRKVSATNGCTHSSYIFEVSEKAYLLVSGVQLINVVEGEVVLFDVLGQVNFVSKKKSASEKRKARCKARLLSLTSALSPPCSARTEFQ
jgi:hypothetical protein